MASSSARQAANQTVSQAQDAFNSTFSSLDTLERSVVVARRRLSQAERDAVNASMDAVPARRDLLRIQNLTGANGLKLKRLSLMVAQMNISLNLGAYLLNQTSVKASDLANSSAALESNVGKEQGTEKALKKLMTQVDAVTHKGPNSVKSLLNRTQTLEAETANFSAVLGEKVRTFLVRRMRRGATDVRKALRRMSQAMPPLVKFPRDLPARQPPLGLDLGLADDG